MGLRFEFEKGEGTETFYIGTSDHNFYHHFIWTRFRDRNLVDRDMELRSRVDNYFLHC